MKRYEKVVTFMAVAVMSLYGYVSFVEYTGSAGMSELMLENVEALAQGEGGNYVCYGSGDIDCHGMKVWVKYEGIR
ncbi:NVEALA domain-containing protein [Phocaeicola coprophilus]